MNQLVKNYIGKRVVIHAYKYNGWLYRAWEFPLVIDETDEYIVLCTKSGEILTSEFKTKRVFRSYFDDFRIWIFFKDQWYNLYIYIKNGKYNYYINISSCFIFEESCFKYVDLDLDFKFFSNNAWNILDVNEFKHNANIYKYPPKLIKIVEDVQKKLNKLIIGQHFTKKFDLAWIKSLYHKYKCLESNRLQKKIRTHQKTDNVGDNNEIVQKEEGNE